MIKHHIVKPRTPEWHALRDRAVATCSKLGALAGVSDWGSPYDVWAEHEGLIAPPEDNPHMWFGRITEVAVAAAVEERYPDLDLEYPLDRIIEDTALGLMGTPDARGRFRQRPDELVAFEFKVIERQNFSGWNGLPPLDYQLQLLGNMMLLDAHRGILAVLVHGRAGGELVPYDYARNPAAEARIRRLVKKTRKAFEEGHAPEPDFSRDAATIAAMYPRHEPGRVLDLSTDNMLPELLEKREVLKEAIAAETKQLEAIDGEIKYKLKDAEKAELPGWKINWKTQQRAGFTVAPTTTRPLKVTHVEDKEKAA